MKYIPINPQPETLLPGMKVQMGPDWGKFEGGHIKVTPNSVGVVGRKFEQGWFEVTWDNGYNCVYCYGETEWIKYFRCEVQVVEPVDEPKTARFKVGDRVVALDNCGYGPNVIGKTGTIMRQVREGLFLVDIPSYDVALNFFPNEIVLAPPETPVEAAQARIDGFEKCHAQCKELLGSPRHKPLYDSVRELVEELNSLKAQIAAAKQALK